MAHRMTSLATYPAEFVADIVKADFGISYQYAMRVFLWTTAKQRKIPCPLASDVP